MYVKVPEDLKEPLLRELRQYRRQAYIKFFPIILLLFSGLGAFVVVAKGHYLIELILENFSISVSTTTLMLAIFGVVVVLMIPFLIFILRKDYQRCQLQECPYCPKCNAVDSFDSGVCLVCQAQLTEKAPFLFTTDRDEEKIIKRRGLEPSRDS